MAGIHCAGGGFGGPLGTVALLELGLTVLLPMTMFASSEVRVSRTWLVMASAIAVLGVALYRFNIVIVGMVESTGAGMYVPHWMEVVIMGGMAAAVALAYLFIVENFPVYTTQDVAASEIAVAEAEAERKAARAARVSAARVAKRTGHDELRTEPALRG